MRAGSVGSWARAGADVRCASSAGSTAVVAITIDAGIGGVRNFGAVGSVGTGRVVVASCASAGVCTGRPNASSVAGGTDTGVCASRSDASGVTSRAKTTGMTS